MGCGQGTLGQIQETEKLVDRGVNLVSRGSALLFVRVVVLVGLRGGQHLTNQANKCPWLHLSFALSVIRMAGSVSQPVTISL